MNEDGRWIKNQKNRNKKITVHKGPKPKIYDIENNLLEFFEFNQKLNNPIKAWGIANEIFK